MKSMLRGNLRPVAARTSRLNVRANWGAPVSFSENKILSNEKIEGTAMSKIRVEVGSSASSFTKPGAYIQAKTTGEGKAGFFAIASPPGAGSVYELLIKASPGTTAEAITQLNSGATLLCSDAQGKGYPLEQANSSQLVILVCAGSGIAPLRSVIESGALKGKKIKLFYGSKARELTAYAELIPKWEAQGVNVTQVFSGEGKNYVQSVVAAELESGSLLDGVDPSKVSVLLCGHKDMCASVTEKMMEKGVAKESILLNF